VNWDDFSAWPPLDGMSHADRCQANAALIREFTGLPLQVEEDLTGGLIVVCAGYFRHPAGHPEDVLEFLEGFLAGCETLAARGSYTSQ
jgi:hypothetical protein